MSLTLCPDCGKEMSPRASACPSCGAPAPKYEKRRGRQSLGAVLAILGVALLYVSPSIGGLVLAGGLLLYVVAKSSRKRPDL